MVGSGSPAAALMGLAILIAYVSANHCGAD
jgi:hypothetical protein